MTNQLKAGIKSRQIMNIQLMDEPPVVGPPISAVSISLVVKPTTSSMQQYIHPPTTHGLAPTHVPVLSPKSRQYLQKAN